MTGEKKQSKESCYIGGRPASIATALMGGAEPDWDTKMREDWEQDGMRIIVDTCLPNDTAIWETGICAEPVEHFWEGYTVVQQYKTQEDAKEGHENWIRRMKIDPKRNLVDIFDGMYTVWGDDFE